MSNYFFDMIPAEELKKLNFVPTTVQLLEKMKNDYGNKVAVVHRNQPITYNELYERIGRRRTFIKGLNLQSGSKIAIFDRNSLDAIELFFAITTLGYVSIFLPAQLAGPALSGSVMKFNVSAMFVRPEFEPVCQQAGVTVSQYPTNSSSEQFTPADNVFDDMLCSIFFTGGTTGVPKGVMLTHHNIMRGSHNGIFMPGSVLSDHRYITFLPFSHVFGTIRGLLSCFYCGATVYTCEDMRAGVGMIPVVRPTCLVVVPGLAEILVNLVKMQGKGFLGGCLQHIICGASNCPPRLIEEFEKLGLSLLQGYGLTESANLVSGNAQTITNPTSVGKFYPYQEYKIVDGELWLKGENIFKGYYGDPKQTSQAFSDGWFRTGDLVRVDNDGYIYITGRIKNLIILKNGENVSPESIEEHFYAHAEIRDCLIKEVDQDGDKVIGVEILPNMERLQGQTPEQMQNTFRDIVDQVNDILPSYMQVLTFSIRTEDFKRTGSMKVMRNQ